ncbi:MAG TPA: polyamine aminopropyltransferase [Roseovarius sp.]|nr:polyamine aminopropyltransferase [Roseovarius sp.]
MTKDAPVARRRELWLLAATFLVAVAGLIYELVAATLSSYLLGDSVRQFSLVIGLFLSSMGLGAWLSRYVDEALSGFVWAQIGLGIVGGFMAPVLFFSYAFLGHVGLLLYSMLGLVGILAGMEIPLIARVLEGEGAYRFRFENVLTADYLGALIASVAFPIIVVPFLGLMSASLVFGCLNLGVAGLTLWLFRDRIVRGVWIVWAVSMLASFGALANSERLVNVVDANLYEDDIILNEATPYQQITVTRFRDRVRLFLDRSIQFDTLDEHRYHEALVHPALSLAPRKTKVLILGGGDGMAAREVLRHRSVETVTLVDLDPRVTELFRDHPKLSPLNDHALQDPRVEIINMDAWKFVDGGTEVYDVIIADLPDPRSIHLSKLYTRAFYTLMTQRLSAQGIFVTQAGSPLFARDAFWSVVATLEAANAPGAVDQGLWTLPYHVHIPSFGDWGFVLAAPEALRQNPLQLPQGLKFLTRDTWQASHVFGRDVLRTDVEINTLQSHALVGYYNAGWDHWFR